MAKTIHYKGLRIKARQHKKVPSIYEVSVYRDGKLMFHATARTEVEALATAFDMLRDNPHVFFSGVGV